MAGHTNFSELRAKMSPERRARNQAAAKQMIADMLLAEIRKLTGLTQAETASAMGISQPALSKIEDQDDIQISTLRRLIEALGGTLEIIANMPGGRISISQFRDVA
jgi:plasmid maintenance system antidote protein VapI